MARNSQETALLRHRPVNAVHCLDPGSEACPLSLRLLVRSPALARCRLPIVIAPIGPIAKGALLAAREARAVIGFSPGPGTATRRWFAMLARAAEEVAPRSPFFVSADLEIEASDQGVERSVELVHELIGAGVTHIGVDASAVPTERRAQVVRQVASAIADHEIAVDCIVPTRDGNFDEEYVASFVEEFEGWGIRADLLSGRFPAPESQREAAGQIERLYSLSVIGGDRPIVRRGPLSSHVVERLGGSHVRVFEDGARALAAGLRAIPSEIRSSSRTAGRGAIELPLGVEEKAEALAYGEVASLLERTGATGSAAIFARWLSEQS